MPNEPSLAGLPSGTRVRRTWCNDAWRRANLACVVAIPARDEAMRIARCLANLQAQASVDPGTYGALVFVNGTTDATFQTALSCGLDSRLPTCIVDGDLPPRRRNAGTARAVAMQIAWNSLSLPEGSLFTTDADSVVPVDWIAPYRALLSCGYDVVAGLTDIGEDDADDMPRSLKARDRLERRYEVCLDALESTLDPVAHDPWPRHYHASGANLAVRSAALPLLMRIAWPPHGEDKCLVHQAEQQGLRVRHDVTHKVMTSGRLFGRANGGMADTLRRRVLDPASPCDERLEAAERACFRALTRQMLRRMHASGGASPAGIDIVSQRIRLPSKAVSDALGAGCFAAAWATIEQQSPRLVRELIRPRHLMHHCLRGEALLARLRGVADHDGVPHLASAP